MIGKAPGDEASVLSSPAGPRTAGSGKIVLAAAILGSSMAFIDGTAVTVALPALQRSLHANVSGVQWVVESYALFLAALLLVGGSLGDIYGRRKIFVLGVTIFALASGWCGLAPGIEQLLMARALQGVGGALLIPGSLALISSFFPGEERGRAIGTWSGFTAITTAIGPVLGGWLVEYASWRWVFFINLPLAAAVVWLALKIPESRGGGDRSTPIDWRGALWITLALAGITYFLTEPARGVAAGVAGVIACGMFLWTEVRSAYPMLPLTLFRSRDFSGANLVTLFLYTALSGLLFFLPLNLIQIQRYSPTAAGAALLPLILLIFALSRWSGGLVARYGARVPLIVGPLIAAAGFALFALPNIGQSYWSSIFPAVVILGLGMAVSVAPLTTAVMEAVPEEQAGIASGTNNAVSRIAGLLAVAVLGFILISVFNQQLDRKLNAVTLSRAERQRIDQDRNQLAGIRTESTAAKYAIAESFVAGYRVMLAGTVLLALASSLGAGLLIKRREGP